METQKKSVMELINAHQAINNLLNQIGLPARAAYWLGRNRDNMQSHLKRWQKVLNKIYDEMSVEMPDMNFVPSNMYAEFKREIRRVSDQEGASVQDILEVFSKFEISPQSDQTRGIPMDKRQDYEKRCQEEADVFDIDLDFNTIEVDDRVDAVLQKISGNEQAALSFMLEIKSDLEIPRMVGLVR